MKKCLSYTCFLLFVCSMQMVAQNITGRWEGKIDENQFLQINVIQKGDEVCGYTFDHLLNNPDSYCRAKFSGHYDAKKRAWLLQGDNMIENSDSHVLMKLTIWMESDDRDDLIRAKVETGKEGLLGRFLIRLEGGFLMSRASGSFIPLGIQMQPCFPPEVTFERKVNKPVQQVTIGDSLPIALINEPIVDMAKKAAPENSKAIVKKDSDKLVNNSKSRQQKEQSHLLINTDKVTLQLYDNGIVDDDTISVIYDGKLLVSHQRLSERPIELHIAIDTSQSLHTITLYAENLGSIPPNTALVVVTAGNKRYELFAKANLSENAVLVFEYRKE